MNRVFQAAIATTGTAMLVLLVATTPALAAAPTFIPNVIDRIDEIPADFCGFPVTAHVVANQTIKVFHDASGAITGGIATGPWKVTYSTPTRVVTVALTGPAVLDANLALVRGTGRWIAFLPDGSAVIASGNLLLRDLGGLPLPTLLDADGHVVDWCQAVSG